MGEVSVRLFLIVENNVTVRKIVRFRNLSSRGAHRNITHKKLLLVAKIIKAMAARYSRVMLLWKSQPPCFPTFVFSY